MADSLKIVFIDIETTGFSHQHDQILQIAAKFENKEFNTYIIPEERRIHPIAAKHTGIAILSDGRMFAKGSQVYPTSIENAIDEFINFLKNLDNAKIILCAHNGCNFDFFFLLRDTYKYEFDIALENIVYGFIDSLEMIKKYTKKQSCSLQNLASEFIPNFDQAKAHNAIYDVRFLEQIINNMKIPQTILTDNIINFFDYKQCFIKKSNRVKRSSH